MVEDQDHETVIDVPKEIVPAKVTDARKEIIGHPKADDPRGNRHAMGNVVPREIVRVMESVVLKEGIGLAMVDADWKRIVPATVKVARLVATRTSHADKSSFVGKRK